MIGVVIVTHGNLADALLSTAELVVGKQQRVKTVSFESGQDVGDLQKRIALAVKEVDSGQGTLILVDILGGSPYNASAILVMENIKIEIIAGVNLPMVFAVLPVREGQLASVADVALECGRHGITKFVMNKAT